ncbi:MAG: FCD domain-containing protein [Spirochaetaceae bacterium]|nr:FCD domain-containing protein [Spirochaetaceae bacterium]
MAYNVQAADLVFNYIAGKIKNREWLPGAKIETEEQLCRKLNVSRTAVRQAIEKLSAYSVLRKIQGSGTYVQRYEDTSLLGLPFYLTGKDVMVTILEFRLMFDSYNAELFIEKCTDKEVALLEENYRQMKESVGDKEKFRFLDNQFHGIIAKGTRNVIIMQIANLFNGLFEEHQLFLYDSVGPDKAIYFHGMILDAIKQKNAELAGIYSRMSIEYSLKQQEKKILPGQSEGETDE